MTLGVFRGKIKKSNPLQKDKINQVANLTLRNASFILIGYALSYVIGLFVIYSETDYLRLRLFYEAKHGIKRESNKELYRDYPYAHKESYLLSDHELTNIKKFKSIKEMQ